ncbi:uncharacterized protein LOC117290770 [Asterias rubens]|uniref:uncharacterized protein LOC117290770 n=1 Tax=Asterias rubens TaxID=7604 RepID=UPI0014552A64|nr:uncharacterized protein LOC117290770 [Asterias rubens]XP_033628219.1 uncharacterized protein LOC117290770 [Asterias rubens]XP_033628228.1 uncharacterized protein LOC117290770 [Asterias rubens]XP_033628237.1 uncharacterized protein LOC117290770 [Asterias rubens]XP_033628245.1 uncharacterized protein LOC117290770 [Asterias rubens]XP_033628252.1 uncharacterized protein LOC117290770 [Asterias rubens]
MNCSLLDKSYKQMPLSDEVYLFNSRCMMHILPSVKVQQGLPHQQLVQSSDSEGCHLHRDLLINQVDVRDLQWMSFLTIYIESDGVYLLHRRFPRPATAYSQPTVYISPVKMCEGYARGR